MQHRIWIILISFFIGNDLHAQLKWPAITPTAKPWTRWWWQGSAVNKKGLTAAMEQYAKAGLGGLELTPIYGVKGYEQQFIPFLSPKWMDMLQHTLQEAKRLHLGIDMATGTGWPFGGPWVTAEDASKYIVCKKYTLPAGMQLKEPLEYMQEPVLRSANPKPLPKDLTLKDPVISNHDLQTLALDQVRFRRLIPLVSLIAMDEQGNFRDVTDKVDAKRLLQWTPEHPVTLYALFQGWHGKMVERAAPGGEGPAIDHFSLQAIRHYLGHFDTAFAGHDLSALRSFFNDSYEVDDARGQADWTPDLFEAFRQKRGYDLRGKLPALFAKDSSEEHIRVLYDYRITISDLLLERFTRAWHSWAKNKGKLVRNQSHGSPSNILDLYEAVDIPETEGTDVLRFKFATSAAHVSGKPLASAEAATWLGEHFQSTLGDVKQAVDKYFIGGVNHIFFHGTNYSPPDAPWPGWLFYAAVHFTPVNPFWKDFPTLNAYIARCQSFLQTGHSDNDLLLYFPFHDRNNQPGKALLHHFDGMEGFGGSAFEHAGKELLQQGYTFDLISDLQLENAQMEHSLIRTKGGHYRAILLAGVQCLPLQTLQKLRALARDGAAILMYKGLPQDVPGYFRLQERRDTFQQVLSGLKNSPHVLSGDDLSGMLNAAKLRKENLQGLQFVRRADDNGHYYFICNSGKERVKDYFELSVEGASIAIFDPMRERAGLALMKGAAVYLDLEPGESCILQVSDRKLTGPLFPHPTATGDPQPVTGNWELRFLSGGSSLPPAGIIRKPGPWTESGAATFSGTAQYRIRFRKPVGDAEAWELNLGTVGESAEVFLNGERMGTLIGPVYKLDIPARALKPENDLRIEVTNGMANRIIDMDKKGIPWKKFYNINMPARLAENRGADGLFTAAGWTPRLSGLCGPVTLTPINFIKQTSFRQ